MLVLKSAQTLMKQDWTNDLKLWMNQLRASVASLREVSLQCFYGQ